jgi:NAD-dependent deacetylase
MECNDLDNAARMLASAKHITVLTGAGVSAESGVPTFRGAGGVWKNFRAEEVATPEAFRRDSALVWEFYNYRRELLTKVRPNAAHIALAKLESATGHFVLVTQNVDGLHQAAGSQRVLEIHGNIWAVQCTQCTRVWDTTGEPLSGSPHCGSCGGLLRPNVVWFGESLPHEIWQQAEHAARLCDCMLVVGTSAQVHPAASLAWIAQQAGAKVIEINLEPTPACEIATLGLYGKAGEILPKLVAQRGEHAAKGIECGECKDH